MFKKKTNDLTSGFDNSPRDFIDYALFAFITFASVAAVIIGIASVYIFCKTAFLL